MRIHSNHTSSFFRTMLLCLEHDPISVTGWSCLILPGLLADDANASEKLAVLEAQFTALDGALVRGAQGDLVVLFRGLGGAGANRLIQSVSEAFEGHEMPMARTYDIFQDCPLVTEEFQLQLSQLDPSKETTVITGRFETDSEGIKHMASVLEETKFGRTYRSPMTVMLVEDDPITARMAGKLLGQDHVLITATNTYEALVNYLLYAPELVFLDINLPDGSGFHVLDQLTACDPDAYIVMFSGNDAIDTILDSHRRGAQGFVVKPFQRDRLKHFIAERERVVAASRS